MRWEPVFQRLAERQADNAHLWRERGRFLARRSRWKEAAEAYARVTQPDEFEQALQFLMAGDSDGYRQLSARVKERDSQSPPVASAWFFAWVCAVGKDSAVEPERLVSWAEAAVQQKRESSPYTRLAAAEIAPAGTTMRSSTCTRPWNIRTPGAMLPFCWRWPIAAWAAKRRVKRGTRSVAASWNDQHRRTRSILPWSISHWLNANVTALEAKAVLGEDAAAGKRPATP